MGNLAGTYTSPVCSSSGTKGLKMQIKALNDDKLYMLILSLSTKGLIINAQLQLNLSHTLYTQCYSSLKMRESSKINTSIKRNRITH